MNPIKVKIQSSGIPNQVTLTRTEMDSILSKTFAYLKEWQKLNNVKGECISNASFAAELLYAYGCPRIKSSIKAKSILAVGVTKDGHLALIGGHLVLQLDATTFMDPSYEISSLTDVEYFDCIVKFKNRILGKDGDKKYELLPSLKGFVEDAIKAFSEFDAFADEVNSCIGTGDALLGNDSQYGIEIRRVAHEYLTRLMQETLDSHAPVKKQKPNDQCACKSGKKYKKCCGNVKTCSK